MYEGEFNDLLQARIKEYDSQKAHERALEKAMFEICADLCYAEINKKHTVLVDTAALRILYDEVLGGSSNAEEAKR